MLEKDGSFWKKHQAKRRYKQGGELEIYEELKVFSLTNMSHEQGLERTAGAGWHLRVSTDVTLRIVGSHSTKRWSLLPFPLAAVKEGTSEARRPAKRH